MGSSPPFLRLDSSCFVAPSATMDAAHGAPDMSAQQLPRRRRTGQDPQLVVSVRGFCKKEVFSFLVPGLIEMTGKIGLELAAVPAMTLEGSTGRHRQCHKLTLTPEGFHSPYVE
jgi:hypothetical protein